MSGLTRFTQALSLYYVTRSHVVFITALAHERRLNNKE